MVGNIAVLLEVKNSPAVCQVTLIAQSFTIQVKV